MSQRYICIHGHFYQPPRENPWLEAVELQESAYPYHDWNQRITAECYAPNADSRMLDARGRIHAIVNNYASISYNFGPTLLAWLMEHEPDTYRAVIAADQLSLATFSGHGSALAQCYNHMIMPLASTRDRRTQVMWGIEDFRYRFQRDPEGMWLPETAVDTTTLEILCDFGIRFTILAPSQATAVRDLDKGAWQDVSDARIDPSMPYLCRLPSGREITLFFYDGPASRAVAFEGLLADGASFARRLLGLFHEVDRPQLVHIATDGETYGHHHRFGDMALAFALAQLRSRGDVRITNYGEFLALHPPTREVRILDNTSWSCVHGIERWRSDCGCHTGGEPQWNQAWRAPLRDAMDWLRDRLAPPYERTAAELLHDPWQARDDYIRVVLDRSPESIAAFFQRHATHELSEDEQIRALKLLELQRHTMLMYTSCGWFFSELSNIETVQVLYYAGRAVQLGHELFGTAIEEHFCIQLQRASSNLPQVGDARRIFLERVKPATVDLLDVTAHFAVSALFGSFGAANRVYCYDVDLEHHEWRETGVTRLFIGRCQIRSRITLDHATTTFAILHFGEHNISGGIRRFLGQAEYRSLAEPLLAAFSNGDLSAVLRLLPQFPDYDFSLRSLFADRQREIMALILEASLDDAEVSYQRWYAANASLMRFLKDLHMPLPRVFTVTAEFILNRGLRRAFTPDGLDLDAARSLLAEVRVTNAPLDAEGLAFELANTVQGLAEDFRRRPEQMDVLETLTQTVQFAQELPFAVDLWKTQNHLYHTVRETYQAFRARPAGDDVAAAWLRHVGEAADRLAVALPTQA